MTIQPPPLPPGAAGKPGVGCWGYGVGVLSLVPYVGMFFAAVSIAWGVSRRAWVLVGLGSVGILLTVFRFYTFYHSAIAERGGTFDRLRAEQAAILLNRDVKMIEQYKVEHGRYPASLREVAKDKLSEVMLYDPTAIQRPNQHDPYFYYQVDPAGGFYLLRSVGQDGIPFTQDDVIPTLSEEERRQTGLRLER